MSDALWVITAAVVNFLLGAMWYSFFGKAWLSAWKLEKKDIRPNDPKPYLLAFIGSLYASYGLYLMLKHIHPQGFVEQLTVTSPSFANRLADTGVTFMRADL